MFSQHLHTYLDRNASLIRHTSRVVHIPSVFWSLQKWISNRDLCEKGGKGMNYHNIMCYHIQRSLYWGNLHKNVLFMLWWNFTLQTFHQTTSCVESVYVHGKITPNPMNLCKFTTKRSTWNRLFGHNMEIN